MKRDEIWLQVEEDLFSSTYCGEKFQAPGRVERMFSVNSFLTHRFVSPLVNVWDVSPSIQRIIWLSF